ncbi:MAG: cytosine permease, partial [Firmicutes bacterium]|nr:cytosine permease [Bacillota bacterium]
MTNFDANKEAQFGLLPITRSERVYNLWDNSCISIGLTIATWEFLIGASLALFVDFWTAVWGTLAGNMLTVLVMTWMPCLSGAKYGVDGYSGAVSFMGTKGKNFILVCVGIFIICWDIVLSVLFARSVANVAAAILGVDEMSHAFVIAMAVLCMVATFLIVWKGPIVIKKFNNICAPLMCVVIIMLGVILTVKTGWGNIADAEPLMPYESKWVNFLIAVELSFGAGLSWWPEMGGLSRLCKSSRAAYWSNFFGLVVAATVATAIGAAACLTIGSEDPTVWMIKLAGIGLGIMALAFIAFANVSSCSTITYTMCLGLKGLNVFQKISWGKVVGGFCAIV